MLRPKTRAARPTRHSSRRLRGVALVAAVLAPIAAITMSAAQQSSANGHHEVAFGAYARPVPGQSRQQAVQALETQLGRTLGVSREFLLWDEAFPTPYHEWLRDGGRTLITSVKPKRLNGTNVTWNSIANAAPGSAIHNELISWVDRMAAFGAPIYFALSHEPEAHTNIPLGTDVQFIAAWRKIVSIARDRAVTNVKFIWIMTDYAFKVPATERRFADKWYPGDTWVDAAGIDPYNWSTCRPETPNSWKSLATLIEPFRLWSLNHPSIELWLTEFASVEDPANPTRKAGWITAARNLFQDPLYARFTGISYYHAEHPTGEYPLCTWWMNTSANSMNAAIGMANDPLYGGTAPTTTTTTTTTTTIAPGTTALVVVGDGANPSAGDVTVGNRLTAQGYQTTFVDDSVVTAAATADVIVVSSSVDSNVLGTKLRTTTSPVLVYKPFSFTKLGLTADANVGSVTTATVAITMSAHAIAAGRSGTVTLTTAAKPIGWGVPAASADIIATSAGKATVFAYDKNDPLIDGVPAPSCRATLPMRHDGLTAATSDLWAIFDAAVAWANAC